VTNDPADPRNDPNMVQDPFIFVKRGDPRPLQWMAEHPDYFTVPAIMVAHGSPPPWPWGGAGAHPPEAAQDPALAVQPRIAGAFAPPPGQRKHQPGGQPWPKDGNGRDWPKDRWGRPMRPLWDYPPGVRAPGEGVAPGAPGSINEAEAITGYRRGAGVFDHSAADMASTRANAADGFEAVARDATHKPHQVAEMAQPGVWSDASPVPGAPAGLPTSGEASTYSDTFVGKKTASMHVYRHEEYTAALLPRTRWLAVPFGTKLRITHAGRTVVVEVNDRGRGNGRENRVLDLSRAAMAYLTGRPTKDINDRTAGLIHLDSIEIVPADAKVGPQ
jgi:rare lipoprotein A